MNRAQWLSWRKLGIGGTDFAAIAGVSPWRTPFDVFVDKTEDWASIPDNPNMATGRRLEAAVLQWMADDIGGTLVEASPVVGPEPLRGTPDGYVNTGDRIEGLEAKVSRSAPWEAIPLHYECQCRVYMACADLPVWHIGAFFPLANEWKRWRLERDPEIEAAIIDRASRWWQAHIVEGDPPAPEGRFALPWLRRKFDDPSAEMLESNNDRAAMALEFASLGKQIAQMQAQRDLLGGRLRQAIGNARGIQGEAFRVIWSRYARRSIDWDRLKAERPDLEEQIEEFRSETPSGSLRVYQEKG